jgi:hypothetical protein
VSSVSDENTEGLAEKEDVVIVVLVDPARVKNSTTR